MMAYYKGTELYNMECILEIISIKCFLQKKKDVRNKHVNYCSNK